MWNSPKQLITADYSFDLYDTIGGRPVVVARRYEDDVPKVLQMGTCINKSRLINIGKGIHKIGCKDRGAGINRPTDVDTDMYLIKKDDINDNIFSKFIKRYL